jgi:hypothetical protein
MKLWTRQAALFTATTLLAGALAVGPAAAGAASIWDGDGPWGPYGFGIQPRLGAPIPPPTPAGVYDDADFDGDGVPNRQDNCLLVPNPDQAPALKPPNGTAIGPDDLLALSARWKNEHPAARFRDDAEVGEACSGYNKNYLRTTAALVKASDERKIEIFKFLGQSGPMFGGSPDPLASDPSPGPGNLVASLPMCSSWSKWAEFGDWSASGFQTADEGVFHQLASQAPPGYDCRSTMQRGWEEGMRHGWAGKRLYTSAAGGRIINRFFPSFTEHPAFDDFARASATTPGVQPLELFPYGNGQSRQGLIFRGRSYIDGGDVILMDWRGFEAWPANFAVPHLGGWLVYDECRAIQTGVYHCTAVVDMVAGERRLTWQEGYMPWVAKGPPSIEEYIAAIR